MTETRPREIYALLLGAASVVMIIDQLSKQLAMAGLDDGPVDLVGGRLTLRLTFNPGGAFGVGRDFPGFFLAATVVVVAIILVWARRLDQRGWAVPLGMILGGGLGNMVDRVLRDTGGQVVDFIDLHWWPVFNLADASIVMGVGVMILLTVRPRPAVDEPQSNPVG